MVLGTWWLPRWKWVSVLTKFVFWLHRGKQTHFEINIRNQLQTVVMGCHAENKLGPGVKRNECETIRCVKKEEPLLLAPTFPPPSVVHTLSHLYSKEMFKNICDSLFFTNVNLFYTLFCDLLFLKLSNTYGYLSMIIHVDLHNTLSDCCIILLRNPFVL